MDPANPPGETWQHSGGQLAKGGGATRDDRPRASHDRLTKHGSQGGATEKGGLVAVRIRSITFDCADPYQLAQFWSRATGFREDPDNPNEPGDPEGLLLSPDGSLALLFVPVPER